MRTCRPARAPIADLHFDGPTLAAHRSSAASTARQLGASRDDAEDIAQEVVIVLVLMPHKPRSVPAWLRTVVRRQVAALARRSPPLAEAYEDHEHSPAEPVDIEDVVDHRRTICALQAHSTAALRVLERSSNERHVRKVRAKLRHRYGRATWMERARVGRVAE